MPLVVVTALIGAGLVHIGVSVSNGDASARSASPAGVQAPEDALQRRVLADLKVFTDWLARYKVEGYVGEVGMPNDGDPRWIRLADRWFHEADRAGLWVDAWSAGEWWDADYVYAPFVPRPGGGPLGRATPTGELLAWQARHGAEPRGVNVSGGEFGAPGSTDEVADFSNENPGVYGRDYHYDSQESFDYLASQGINTVRLPFRWERIQPVLGGNLDPHEVERLKEAIGRAHTAGLAVILDVHNFGAYFLADGTRGVRRPIGSTAVSFHDFADLWRRLSVAFAGQPGVVAYDLMNEPSNMSAVGGLAPARVWETASQAAVTAIRAQGDDTLIMVGGYQYSHAGDWSEEHPRPWIDDPAHHVRYEAHQYWSSADRTSYDTEVTQAEAAGY